MSLSIITKNGEKTFSNKEIINISSRSGFDVELNTGFDFILALQYDSQSGKCYLLNQFNSDKFLFRGQVLPQKLEIEKVCKIMVKDSDEFITIKVNGYENFKKVSGENITEQDLKDLYGSDVNSAARLRIEKRKSEHPCFLTIISRLLRT